MPGTRTAPLVTAVISYKVISLTWYDYTGDQRTDSYQVDSAATGILIEAFVAALVATSNATLWKIIVQDVWNSVGDSSNALEEVWENAKDNVVLLAKDAVNNSIDVYIPSPINAMFLETTENIDPTNAALAAVLAAFLAIKATFSWVSARFTHRKQIGTRVKF